jgi:hypothetical protein
MSATTVVIVPLAVKALTNEQLLALYNRWSTKPCKKFEKRSCGEQRVARLLEDLEMDVDTACAPPSEDGFAGNEWDAAFPPQEDVEEPEAPQEDTETDAEAVEPVEAPEATIEDNSEEPTNSTPTTLGNAFLAIGGLPDNSDPMGWAPDFAKKLKRPILVLSKSGEVLATVEPCSAKHKTRAAKEGLSKSGQAVFDLASRPEGATAKELLGATGWSQGSWPPLCNRIGTAEVDVFPPAESRRCYAVLPLKPRLILARMAAHAGQPSPHIAGHYPPDTANCPEKFCQR